MILGVLSDRSTGPDIYDAEKDQGRMLHYEYGDFVLALARKIKTLRKKRDLTQMQMVTLYGYHLSHWQNIEAGRKMSLQTLLRVANTFEISVCDLLEGIEQLEGPGPGSAGFETPCQEDDEAAS